MESLISRRTLPALLAQATLIGAVALPLSAAAIWIFWDALAPIVAQNAAHAYDLSAIDLAGRAAGFALFVGAAAIEAYGLLGLRETFREASHGRAFSDRAVRGFHRFAWVSLSMVLVSVAKRTALIFIASINDPVQPGALSIQIGTPEIKDMFMALLLVFVARVFVEGKSAADENAAFV